MMALQVLQNVSDTVSPLDKMLLERQEECWLMLNKTFTPISITTAAPGKAQSSLESLSLRLFLWFHLPLGKMFKCCCMLPCYGRSLTIPSRFPLHVQENRLKISSPNLKFPGA
jgi:hypothetical protein